MRCPRVTGTTLLAMLHYLRGFDCLDGNEKYPDELSTSNIVLNEKTSSSTDHLYLRYDIPSSEFDRQNHQEPNLSAVLQPGTNSSAPEQVVHGQKNVPFTSSFQTKFHTVSCTETQDVNRTLAPATHTGADQNAYPP